MAEGRKSIELKSTGYSTLPSPPRQMRRAAATRHAEAIRSAADTQTDIQTPSDTILLITSCNDRSMCNMAHSLINATFKFNDFRGRMTTLNHTTIITESTTVCTASVQAVFYCNIL